MSSLILPAVLVGGFFKWLLAARFETTHFYKTIVWQLISAILWSIFSSLWSLYLLFYSWFKVRDGVDDIIIETWVALTIAAPYCFVIIAMISAMYWLTSHKNGPVKSKNSD